MDNIEIRNISDKYFKDEIPQNYVATSTTIGSGDNGTVTIEYLADVTTTVKVKAALASGNSNPLSVEFKNNVLNITLATDGTGATNATANTAKLVAEAINKVDNFTAVASGTGATAIPIVSQKNFTLGKLGTPCPIVGLAFVKMEKDVPTYYVATDDTINTTQNKAWKTFTLSDLT